MYRPAAFAEDDVSVILAMIERAPLAHLVAVGADGLEASPLPVLADERSGSLRIRGHLARPNPLWRLAPCRALLIVPVTDAYVSPSWYPTKSATGKVVPTWNYEVVHAHGELIAHDDVAWLDSFVRELTDRHEQTRAEPWTVDDAPGDFVGAMLRGIVGVELLVDRLEGKRKLSQNRSDEDQHGVIAGLDGEATTGAEGVAAAMSAARDQATIAALAATLDRASVRYWLMGGWAVDAHLGRTTRRHSDIDFAVLLADRATLTEALGTHGLVSVPGAEPAGEIFDGGPCRVEITYLVETPTGEVVTPGFEHWPWAPGAFDVEPVAVNGVEVPIVSVGALIDTKAHWEEHIGEPMRPHDRADLEALRALG